MRHHLRPPQEEPQANEQEDTRGLWWFVAVAAAVFLAYVATLVVIVTKADAHDALPTAAQPEGWTYGWECCSIRDCRRLNPSEVSETSAGYVIKATGEVIPYADKRVKISKDEFFHQCTPAGDPKAKKSICLYIPNKAY